MCVAFEELKLMTFCRWTEPICRLTYEWCTFIFLSSLAKPHTKLHSTYYRRETLKGVPTKIHLHFLLNYSLLAKLFAVKKIPLLSGMKWYLLRRSSTLLKVVKNIKLTVFYLLVKEKEIFTFFENTFHSSRKLTLNGKIVDAIIRIIDI